ncbi:MAG: lipopolysaccharide transport periplasmic protein LptA [Nitrosomonadales bacterium]|nr:lipopolysaccharide transport periplasmic protein LptA [Nitrosomonadales bacterium]
MKLQNVKFIIPLLLALAASPALAERADRDKPVHLEADQVSIDDTKQVSTFEGKVQLSQGTMLIRGDRMVVVQDKEGYTHGTATGQPASFRQKRENTDDYVEGSGERIEYDTRNDTVLLLGQARMKRGQDEVRGDRINYNSRTEIFQVVGSPGDESASKAADASRGRVRVIIQPKNSTQPQSGEPLPITPADTLPEGGQ